MTSLRLEALQEGVALIEERLRFACEDVQLHGVVVRRCQLVFDADDGVLHTFRDLHRQLRRMGVPKPGREREQISADRHRGGFVLDRIRRRR